MDLQPKDWLMAMLLPGVHIDTAISFVLPGHEAGYTIFGIFGMQLAICHSKSSQHTLCWPAARRAFA